MRVLMFLLLGLLLALPVTAQESDDSSTVTFNEPVSASLTTAAPQMAYIFMGENGQTVLITLTSDDFDTFLILRDADGNELTRDDDSGPGPLDSRIGPYVLPTDGPYTVVVDSYSHHFNTNGGVETGSFTLAVSPVTSERIAYDATINAALTDEAPEHYYVFNGAAGDLVTVALESRAFETRLRLRRGDQLLAAADSFASGTDLALIAGLTLPEDGDYVIIAGGVYPDATGSFELTLSRTPVTEIDYNSSIDGTIDAGNRLLYYSFDGAAGDIVSLRVVGASDFDTTLTVNAPDGSQLAFQDDTFDLDPAITDLILTESGTYTVLVQPYQIGGSGTVALALTQGELLTLDDGVQVIEFAEGNTREIVSFTGEADAVMRLTLIVEDGDFVSPNLTVTQDGQTLAYTSASGVARQSFDFTVAADGPVYVQIEDYTYDPVRLRLEMEPVGE